MIMRYSGDSNKLYSKMIGATATPWPLPATLGIKPNMTAVMPPPRTRLAGKRDQFGGAAIGEMLDPSKNGQKRLQAGLDTGKATQ